MPPFLGLSSTAWKNLRLACALSRARDKAHARRYFFQALQLNAKDLVALGIVVEIDKLFELEADAKAAGLGAAERLELRPQRAQPIVEALKAKVKSARASALPRSALGKCDYTLGRWGQLRRFLDYVKLTNPII
jgi:transposase